MNNILIRPGWENRMPDRLVITEGVGFVFVNKDIPDKKELMLLTVFKH